MRFAPALALSSTIVATGALARADGDDLTVHLRGDSGLVLERRIEGTALWESLCTNACDTTVPHDGMYRVTGRALRPSLPIALLPSRDHKLSLDVTPGYRAAWLGGIVMMTLGPFAMLGGVVATSLNATEQRIAPCPFDVACNQEPQSNALLVGGVMTVIIGTLMTAAGVVSTVVAEHSRVRQVVSLSPRGVAVTF